MDQINWSDFTRSDFIGTMATGAQIRTGNLPNKGRCPIRHESFPKEQKFEMFDIKLARYYEVSIFLIGFKLLWILVERNCRKKSEYS